MVPTAASFGVKVTSPCGLTICRPLSRSCAARRGRTRKVTSRPAWARRPPKYPPVAPAPTTKRRMALFLLFLSTHVGGIAVAEGPVYLGHLRIKSGFQDQAQPDPVRRQTGKVGFCVANV